MVYESGCPWRNLLKGTLWNKIKFASTNTKGL